MTDIFDDYQHAYDLYDQVKAHKDEILRDMEAGNVHAKTIVATYNMLVRFPEGGAFGILKMSFEEWLKERSAS